MNLDFLKIKRKQANKTQADVANALRIGPQAYAKIESGENNLHPKHWKKLESLLNITQDDLANFTATVAIERRKKKTETEEAPPPADPLLQIVLERWQGLSDEERGRVAGIVCGMGKKLLCPVCRAELPEDWERGITHECPSCGQHIHLK